MNRTLIKFIKFGTTGGVAALTDLVLLVILVDVAGINYLISTVFAYAVAIIVNFLMQKIWVFEDKDKSRSTRQFSLFVILSLINLGVNTFLMYIFVEYLSVSYIISQIIIITVLTLVNWKLYGRIFNAQGRTSIFMSEY